MYLLLEDLWGQRACLVLQMDLWSRSPSVIIESELHDPPNQADLKLLILGKIFMGKQAPFWATFFHKHPLVTPAGGRALSGESGWLLLSSSEAILRLTHLQQMQ